MADWAGHARTILDPLRDPVWRNRTAWIDAQMSTPAISANAVSRFVAAANASSGGVDISFRIVDATGMTSLSLLRAKVMDVAQATVLQTWTASESAFTWSDTDALLQQMGQAYYWLKLEPVNTTGKEVTVGPQYILLNPSLLPPLALAGVSASHAAAVNGTVLVTCNVSAIDTGNSVKIYVTGYHGSPARVAVAQRAAESLQFTLDATGETVTLEAIAVSSGGAEASSGPSCTLTLSAAATAPAEIQFLTVTQIATGNQVEWASSLETGVTSYQLYRGQRGDTFANASLLATIAATSEGTVIYLDTGGLGGDFQYFVIAVSAAGNSLQSPAANPQVLYSSALVPGNVSANATNDATLDSIDGGTSATVRIYGPGGMGTSYTRHAGFGTLMRVGGSVTGLAYSTQYYIIYANGSYQATTNYKDTLPDGYEWVGTLETCPAGGGGGASATFTQGFDSSTSTYYFADVEPFQQGYGYGSASVTITGGIFTDPGAIYANCSGGKVVSYTVGNPGQYSDMTGVTLTVNLDTPYTGGGSANGGSRYVQTPA